MWQISTRDKVIFIGDAYMDLLRIGYGKHKVIDFNVQAIKSLTVVIKWYDVYMYTHNHVYLSLDSLNQDMLLYLVE